MIKATELRIGNIVDWAGTSCRIESIEARYGSPVFDFLLGKLGTLLIYRCDQTEFGGIPLTPEILEKCGLKFDPHHDDGIGPFFKAIMDGKAFVLKIGENGDYFYRPYSNNPIEFLHQLQNLFFALTGEELTVNL